MAGYLVLIYWKEAVLKTVGEEFQSEGVFQQAGSSDLVSKDRTIIIRNNKLKDVQIESDSVWYENFAKPIYVEKGEYFQTHFVERFKSR